MSLFFIMTAWAFLEALQDPEPAARLISPSAFFLALREMMEIFLLTCLGAGTLSAASARLPGFTDYFAASAMILFYLYGRKMQHRESFIGMAYASVFFLIRENSFFLIALRSAEIAAGVAGIRMILKGIQKRQLFFPPPVIFSGPPGFFIAAGIISLILSTFFVR